MRKSSAHPRQFLNRRGAKSRRWSIVAENNLSDAAFAVRLAATDGPRDGDAGEDEEAADDAGGGERLAEEDVGDEEGDDGDEVEAERAADRPEALMRKGRRSCPRAAAPRRGCSPFP